MKEAKNFLFVAVFLVPSVLFWGSGIFKEGVVANEKNIDAAKNFEVFAKVKQHKDEDPRFLKDMMLAFNETFGDGEYHGEKNWHGIKAHLHADMQNEIEI